MFLFYDAISTIKLQVWVTKRTMTERRTLIWRDGDGRSVVYFKLDLSQNLSGSVEKDPEKTEILTQEIPIRSKEPGQTTTPLHTVT
jgi:hypothetical protein